MDKGIMKLMILLLLTACGKGDEARRRLHHVSWEEAARDADGDGARDWDERREHRDPRVADVPSGRLPAFKTALLRTQRGESVEVKARVRRVWREALVRAAGATSPKVELPLENTLQLRLAHLPVWWRARLTGKSFTNAQLVTPDANPGDPLHGPIGAWTWFRTSRGHVSAALPLAARERRNGELNLGTPLPALRARSLMSSAYRLVVSLPRHDLTFYLSPQLAPMDFLASRFTLRRDHQGRVVALGEHVQAVPHPVAHDLPSSEGVWRAVNMDERWRGLPRSGETYALVWATLGEIAAAQLPVVNSSADLKAWNHPLLAPRPLTLAWVVHVPPPARARWRADSTKTENTMDRPSDRERDLCRGALPWLRSYRPEPFTRTSDLLRFFRVSEAGKEFPLGQWGGLKVEWEEHHPAGSALGLSLRLGSVPTVLGTDPAWAARTVDVRRTRAPCPARRAPPLRVPVWRGVRISHWWEAGPDVQNGEFW